MHDIVVQIMALLVAITVHEMAHGWMAHRLGDITPRLHGRLSFNPLAHIDPFGTVLLPLLLIVMRSPFLIGWAKPVPVNAAAFRKPRQGMALVSLAGPAANLATAFLSATILKAGFLWPATGGPVSTPLFSFLLHNVSINVILAVFNLIPIPPLDGSGILEGVLPPDLAREYNRVKPFGMILVFVLLWLGVLNLILVPIHSFLMNILLR